MERCVISACGLGWTSLLSLYRMTGIRQNSVLFLYSRMPHVRAWGLRPVNGPHMGPINEAHYTRADPLFSSSLRFLFLSLSHITVRPSKG